MHQIFTVTELVLETFNNLSLPCPYRGNGETLSRLARTCRKFHGPAIEVLWRELDGFDPFLYWLDARWHYQEEHRPTPILKLNNQPKTRDWNRFLPYANCVRKISLSTAFRVDPSVLVALARAQLSVSTYPIQANVQQLGLCLLPQLRELSWRYHCNESDCWSGMLFLCPSITKLVMLPVEDIDEGDHYGGSLTSTFVPVFTHALAICKNVSSLSIFADVPKDLDEDERYRTGLPDYWNEYNWNEIADVLNPFFQNGAQLEELVLCNGNLTTHAVLQFLRSMPTLRLLELGRSQCPLKYDSVKKLRPEDVPRAFSFRSLTNLDITSSLDTAVKFIRYIHSPIDTLTLSFLRDDGGDLAPWLAAVRDKFSDTLQRFSLVVAEGKTWQWDANLLVAFVSGLRLTKLEVDFGNGLIMNDEVLLKLGRALPLLEILYLPCSRDHSERPNVTLKGLLLFLGECFNMDILEMAVDALDVDFGEDDLSLTMSELRLLSLDASPINKAYKVAEVFNTFLPCLEDFDWEVGYGKEEYGEAWEIVWESHRDIGLDGLEEDNDSDASSQSSDYQVPYVTVPVTRSRFRLTNSEHRELPPRDTE